MLETANLPVFVSAALILAGAIVTGIFGVINRRSDSKIKSAPTVQEIWARLDTVETKLDTERTARMSIEERFRTLRDIFLDYVNRVQTGGSSDLTHDERTALEETKEKP